MFTVYTRLPRLFAIHLFRYESNKRITNILPVIRVGWRTRNTEIRITRNYVNRYGELLGTKNINIFMKTNIFYYCEIQ